jgi:hypothetical protein
MFHPDDLGEAFTAIGSHWFSKSSADAKEASWFCRVSPMASHQHGVPCVVGGGAVPSF